MTRSKSILSALLAVAFLAPGVASAEDGKKLFAAKCAACHGADGKGKTKQGEKMKIGDLAAMKDKSADKITKTIEDGISREKEGVKQEMKPMKGKVTPEQIKALADFVMSLK